MEITSLTLLTHIMTTVKGHFFILVLQYDTIYCFVVQTQGALFCFLCAMLEILFLLVCIQSRKIRWIYILKAVYTCDWNSQGTWRWLFCTAREKNISGTNPEDLQGRGGLNIVEAKRIILMHRFVGNFVQVTPPFGSGSNMFDWITSVSEHVDRFKSLKDDSR